jgi:hypothetical protein
MNQDCEKQLKVIKGNLSGDATAKDLKLGCDMFADASPDIQKAVLSHIVLAGDRLVVEKLFVLLEQGEFTKPEMKPVIQVIKSLLQHTFNVSIASDVIATALTRKEKKTS